MIGMITMPLSFMWNGNGCGTAIVLSGIQSTAYGQALGLRPVLEKHYKWIIGYDYNTLPTWYPELYATEFAEIAAYWQRTTGSVALYGLSIGAQLSVLTTDAMRKLAVQQRKSKKLSEPRHAVVDDRSRYRVVMVDPPFGGKTMLELVKKHLPGFLMAFGGAVVPQKVNLPIPVNVPTDGDLWLPTHKDMASMFQVQGLSDEQYIHLAREADVKNQTGYPLANWLQQLAWLAGPARKLPFSAMAGVRADLITAKSEHNTVVNTELAEPEWLRRVWFDYVLNVDAEHCATLRHQPVYAARVRELLNKN